MKVEVGYITAWRKAIFFSAILGIILLGTVSTVCQKVVGKGLVSNVIMVMILMVIIILVILVIADKWDRYRGIGTAVFENNHFIYNDKKRHFDIPMDKITKIDMEEMLLSSKNSMSSGTKKVLAYRMLIQAGKKKYYIESERSYGRLYNEVDLYKLYLELQSRNTSV